MIPEISRRNLFKGAGALGAAVSLTRPAFAEQQQVRQPPPSSAEQKIAAAIAEQPRGKPVYLFFNETEAQFVEAAVARLIPKDENWPGADEAGVPIYIDQQLAGAYGAGDRLYLDGPWQQGTPQQGYQLPYTPAQLYRAAIDALHTHLTSQQGGGKPFHELSSDKQDSILTQLETGELWLSQAPSDVFFETLLSNTIEGFFADPVYGGNRDMVGWRMVGFPGAYAAYLELVDQHGIAFKREPLSLASTGRA